MSKTTRILVVEDEENLRNLLSMVLKQFGWDVVTASNGNEAIQCFNQNPFDLVITDLIMPEKEGLETIIELRKKYPGTKIIAMSGGLGQGPETYLKIAEHLGAKRILAKPFRPEELIKMVREVLAVAP